MARVTADKAAKNVGGRFDLVIVAAHRAREIKGGSPIRVPYQEGETAIVTALREIEEGLYTKEDFLNKVRKKHGNHTAQG